MNLKTIKNNFSGLGTDIDRHDVFTLASSLAYTTALALAPFLLILLSIAAILGPELQNDMVRQITQAMGTKAGHSVLEIVQGAKERPGLSGLSGLGGLIILAISASAIFSQLRVALDRVNGIKLPTNNSGIMGFVKSKILSFGLVFGFIFLSIVSLLISTVISAFIPGGEGIIWQLVFLAFNFFLFTGLFAMIYRFVPTKGFDWKRCRVMGLVSAIFYLIGKALITLYLGHAGLESSYGAAGSFVVFLAWVYYTTLTLLVSCEFSNNFFFKNRKWTGGLIGI